MGERAHGGGGGYSGWCDSLVSMEPKNSPMPRELAFKGYGIFQFRDT